MPRNRAYRREHRTRVIKNRIKELKSVDPRYAKVVVLGKMAKKHPLDCGSPGCLLCHGDKIYNKGKARKKKWTED